MAVGINGHFKGDGFIVDAAMVASDAAQIDVKSQVENCSKL